MALAINTSNLIHKTKEELLTLLSEQVEEVRYSEDADSEWQALENIEQITYVLRNCDYKDSTK